MSDLRVTVDDATLSATWAEENETVRAALADALPVAGDATRWGDELYFDVPLDAEPATTREAVRAGALAYWPAGDALCLFWGPTPASTDDTPRAAAPVAVVAHIAGTGPLDDIEGSAWVRVARA